MSSPRLPRLLAAALALFGTAGCDPKFGDFMKERELQTKTLAERVRAVAASVKASPQPGADSACEKVTLTLNHEDAAGNAEIYAASALEAFTADTDIGSQGTGGIDASLALPRYGRHDVSIALSWARQARTGQGQIDRLQKSGQEVVERALNMAYLIVPRTRPEATRGRSDTDVFVADLGTAKILCSFTLSVESDPNDQAGQVVNVYADGRREATGVAYGGYANAIRSATAKQFQEQLEKRFGARVSY